MLKLIAFVVGSLIWIAVCWFFGSMAALTESGPKSSIVQNECANLLIARAQSEGRVLDRMDALYSPECRAEQRRVMDELSRPYLAKALMIAFLPVLLLGGVLFLRRG
ncbi:hypothetical protein M0208_00140 [Sphingomonas sp. SUN019]|uniref:hypothetical protein n=1 Tax=Sphingomonas sp. SUN019 TaxID=2937788 RepID=UPI00216435C9|nr:hypothetical protein [Sphingomonas sp. SUN019]UVO49010.1 hypothetical protein M0208_00140 [Sphingomonas sp. SUN019]